MSLSVGGVGMVREEVTFVGAPMLSRALNPSLQVFETWLLFVDRQYRWIYCVALMHIRAVLPNDHPDGRSTRSRAHEVNVVS